MHWSSHSAIRSRREQLGLSQSDLARHLGVTKSILSHIEAGKRQPTDDQIETLAMVLRLPPDLLLLGSGRLPEDVRGIFQMDATAGIPAVRQRTEGNVLSYPWSPETLPLPKPAVCSRHVVASVPERINVAKTSTPYRAHSYHTKVPPEAIIPFIRAFTRAGETIFDPFCGSGMTGVAATLTGRRAILNDLSPAAVHLTWNHTRPCDPASLLSGFSLLEERLGKRLNELYRTTHTDGTPALIYWTLWSTEHRCPVCSQQFLLWDAIDRATGRLGGTISCPHCSKQLIRRNLDTLRSVPAWISYALPNGRRHEKPASPDDVDYALSFRRESIAAWFPTTPIGPDREMYIRCALHLQGIASVADFYTARNLEALALLWREILDVPDDRVQRALAFAFTNTAWHGTRMRRFNARGGQRPLTGTLYIPQLSSEANVFEVMRNKINQLQRYYRTYRPRTEELPAVILGSASNLAAIPSASIDYVFTDPPFGLNIFYADCNLIGESWLGHLTEVNQEAVVNRSLLIENGGKSLSKYAGFMATAMQEMVRVLKPGGWATVVFHNTDADVWQTIREAASAAGFEFHEAACFQWKPNFR